jgi:hypothetical protein
VTTAGRRVRVFGNAEREFRARQASRVESAAATTHGGVYPVGLRDRIKALVDATPADGG